MKPIHRSLSGLLIALVSAPVFLALVACIPTFPVPVGNPEKSRIDPAISGMWLVPGEEFYIYVFEPFDKRAWLLSAYEFSSDEDECNWIDAPEFDDTLGDVDEFGPDDEEFQQALDHYYDVTVDRVESRSELWTQAARRFRPFLRRRPMTTRPPLVRIRARNPCVFARFRLFG